MNNVLSSTNFCSQAEQYVLPAPNFVTEDWIGACNCPLGDYLIQMWDGYGDGWNEGGGGSGILQMCVDDICENYTVSEGNYNQVVVNVETNSSIYWFWSGDAFLNEVVFSITTPSGNQFLYKGAEELTLYSNGLFPENVDSAVLVTPGIIPVMCN